MFRGVETGRTVQARRWLWASLVAAVIWLVPGQSRASGEHQVPDLRQEHTKKWERTKVRLRIPITLHVATVTDRPALDPGRLQRSLKQTNAALAGFGIEMYIARIVLMPEGYAGIKHRRHRRALAEYAPIDGTVHVFLVQSVELGSVARADRGVRGLHWRYRGLRRKLKNREYVVIGSDAPSTTLVHEVGHLFGLEHDAGRQNLMCSCREGPRQIFTRSQGVEIRKGATQFVGRTPG